MTLFDAYVMVDWSAASKRVEGKDSIWVGSALWEQGGLQLEPSRNPATRSEATRVIQASLERFVQDKRRVLVGFDFAYGYPRGLAAALRADQSVPLGQPDWRFVWQELAESVRDDADNQNNRFEVAGAVNARLGGAAGPFYGCPGTNATQSLASTGQRYPVMVRDGIALPQYRLTESRLRGRQSLVQESWKLYGAGCVGSQALVGIPRVAALRWAPTLDQASAVWPFETGFCESPGIGRRPFILHAEIWPGVAPLKSVADQVRDQTQVETLARFFARKDETEELGPLFAVPEGLTAEDQKACTREEGWILGA